MEVSRQIRAHREELGLSQEQFARAVYVTRQTVSNWETGKTYPDVQSLLIMSNIFSVPIDELVKGDVAAMQQEMRNYEKERFALKVWVGVSWGLLALAAAMSVLLLRDNVTFYSPLYFVPMGLLAAAIVFAFIAEAIKNRLDIDTMHEVSAFLNGKDPEDITRERKLPKWGRAVLCLVGGAVFGVVFYMILAALVGL